MSHKVTGIEDDGVLIFQATEDSTDIDPGSMYISGETLEEYGIDNLDEEEAKLLLSILLKRNEVLQERAEILHSDASPETVAALSCIKE